MTKKIQLLRAGYGGLPYPEGSVLEIADDEGAFVINSGAAKYVADDTPVTPVPTGEVLSAAAANAKKAEEDRLKAMPPSERKKLEEAQKKAEEDRKWKEEDDKAKAKAAEEVTKANAEALRKAEEDKIRVSQPKAEPHKEAANVKR